MTHHNVSTAQQTRLIIKERRQAKGLTQEKLAGDIGVSPRVVRMWESGERSPKGANRETLVHLLGIQPELLGLPEQVDYSQKSIELTIKNIERSLDDGAFMSAWSTSDLLVKKLTRQAKDEGTDLLVPLNYARYLAGHSISIVQNDPLQALGYFKAMTDQAYQLHNNTLLCIALTYQGEMYRRKHDYDKAIFTIEKALQVPNVDIMARGNAKQLLARAYAAKGDKISLKSAKSAMDEAIELAIEAEKYSSSIYVCFHLCGVYIDYAKMSMRMGSIKQGLKYITAAEKIEKLGHIAPRWSIPTRITFGEMLMSKVVNTETSGIKSILNEQDYQRGEELVGKGYLLAKECGHQRQMRHALALPSRFAQRGTRNNEVAQALGERLHSLSKNDAAF